MRLGNASVVAVYSSGNNINRNPTLSAINATGTATAAQIVSGYITSTTSAAVSITLPTATQIATEIGGTVARGTSLYFTIDNSGANSVTVVMGSGITLSTDVWSTASGMQNNVVLDSSDIGLFRIVFLSGTTAKIFALVRGSRTIYNSPCLYSIKNRIQIILAVGEDANKGATSGTSQQVGTVDLYLRSCRLAFYNNSLTLPAGLSYVDDLDTATGGWEQ